MDKEEVARKFALKNAVDYGGEANSGAVIGQVFNEFDGKLDKAEVGKIVGKVCGEINQLSIEEQKKRLEQYEFEEEEQDHDPIPDLETEEGEQVVVRFAPNPNGAPHLGHARGMTINGELKNKYDGKLILRYDDTDPVTKRPREEAYELQKEGFEWLGYEIDEVRYCSKNFDTYIEYAEELIQMGKAYVSQASQEEMQKHRREGTASEYRDQSPEENMELWKKMRNGELDEGEAVLKVKTDLDHKNPAVRDFVAFRIIDNPDHPITGDEYRVWPLLDFQGAIEDHEMGTTHIVRGKELRASTKRQKFIYNYFDWEYPNIRYWGNVQVSGFDAPMSTSTIGEMIDEGELSGWDDPRCGTIEALDRRGFQPDAVREFYIEMGVTENDVEASIETLETNNRDIIDHEAKRLFFVEEPVKITIKDVPENIKAEMPVHPDKPETGVREPDLNLENGEIEVYIKERDLNNDFLRLKGLCNLEMIDGSTAEYVEGDHTVAIEKDADIIHWAPVADSKETKVHMNTGEIKEGYLENYSIDKGEIVQLERFGFAKKEKEGYYIYTHG